MSIAKQKMEDANLAAQDAYSVANLLKSKFENIVNSLNDMNKKLTAFISGNQATPDEIITVVNQVQPLWIPVANGIQPCKYLLKTSTIVGMLNPTLSLHSFGFILIEMW